MRQQHNTIARAHHRKTVSTIEVELLPSEGRELPRKSEAKKAGADTLGQRLARIRRERGLTQIELAERLGTVQPVISDYERGLLRMNGEVIIALARILSVSADELLGIDQPRAVPTVKNRRLLRRLHELDQLPQRDQQALLRTIEAFLRKAG